jgi:hypothetical protein
MTRYAKGTLAALIIGLATGCATQRPAQTATLEEANAGTPTVETASSTMPLCAGDMLGMHLFHTQDVASLRVSQPVADVRD